MTSETGFVACEIHATGVRQVSHGPPLALRGTSAPEKQARRVNFPLSAGSTGTEAVLPGGSDRLLSDNFIAPRSVGHEYDPVARCPRALYWSATQVGNARDVRGVRAVDWSDSVARVPPAKPQESASQKRLQASIQPMVSKRFPASQQVVSRSEMVPNRG